jgi:hypothetical protein
VTVRNGQPWGAAWRNKVVAAVLVLVGLLGLSSGVVLVVLSRSYAGDLSAYDASPQCAPPSAALLSRNCRYSGQAAVTSVHRDKFLDAVVAFAALPGRSFSTSFPTDHEPSADALKAGGTAVAVLWNGRIRELAGQPTVDNPQNRPIEPFRNLSLLFGLAGVVVLVGGVFQGRAAWRR